MTKNTDWAYETELRIAVAEIGLPRSELDTPLMVSADGLPQGGDLWRFSSRPT
jgi:hypothetical protein